MINIANRLRIILALLLIGFSVYTGYIIVKVIKEIMIQQVVYQNYIMNEIR